MGFFHVCVQILNANTSDENKQTKKIPKNQLSWSYSQRSDCSPFLSICETILSIVSSFELPRKMLT